MKTVNDTTGFNEREKKHENTRGHPTYRPHNIHYYNGINSKSYYGTCIRSYRPSNHIKSNMSRGKIVKHNEPKIPSLMSLDIQNSIAQSEKEIGPWSEEALELKRKQQLSVTANKLLNKLKIWNTGKNDEKEPELSFNEGTNKAIPESSNQKEKVKNKQVLQIQNKKVGNVHYKQGRRNQKASLEKARKKTFSCDKFQLKNKLQRTSEYKQKKIHQNIIGELMTMPKENLNKVLMNPKIHPKIERKMAQIVKENRLILAQKFRHLAESKINSQGQGQFQFQSKFVNDVENLIDPDFAIDLCQLPPELIKQMGDIFQLDFDSCLTGTDVEGSRSFSGLPCIEITDKTEDYNDSRGNDSISIFESNPENNFERVNMKLENLADICDIMEIGENKIGKISIRDFASCCDESPVSMDHSSVSDYSEKSGSEFHGVDGVVDKSCLNINQGNLSKKRKKQIENSEKYSVNTSYSGLVSKKLQTHSPTDINSLNGRRMSQCGDYSTETISPQAIKQEKDIVRQLQPSAESQIIQNNVETDTNLIVRERRICDYCRNENLEKKSCEIQTVVHLLEKDHSTLFQPNLPENLGETEKAATLKEIDMIDQLIHELNQRRFFLFLKLLNLKSCSASNALKKKLLKAMTNNDRTIKRKVKNIQNYNPDWIPPILSKETKKKKSIAGNSEQGAPAEKKADQDETDCIRISRKVNSNEYKGSF